MSASTSKNRPSSLKIVAQHVLVEQGIDIFHFVETPNGNDVVRRNESGQVRIPHAPSAALTTYQASDARFALEQYATRNSR